MKTCFKPSQRQNVMFFLLYFSCSHFTFAHRVPVHEQITLNAVASATQSSSGYNEFMATIGGSTPLRSMVDLQRAQLFGWLKVVREKTTMITKPAVGVAIGH